MIFGKRKINKFLLSAMFLVAVFLLFSKVNAQVNTLDFQETFSKPYNGTLQHDEWNMLLGTTTDQMFDSSGNPYGFFLSTLYPSITKGQLGINIIPGVGTGGTSLKVRSHGGNILGLYDNTGSEVFTVLNNGNMGLGITNPSQKIDVNGIVKATAVVSTGVTSHPTGIGPYVETYVYSGDTGRLFAFDGASYYDLAIGDWNSGNPNIMLKTGGNVGINRGNPSYKLDVAGTLRTDNGANLATVSGNIGIGTTAPATKLHVVGGGSAIVRNDTMSFDNDYDLINKGYLESVIPDIIASSTSSSTDLFWQGSLTGNISNSNSGNVGIGTSNPSQALDVAGNIKLATTLLSDSNLGIKSAATIKFLDNTNTELLTILQSGNVGIGVSNPANKLTIASSDDKDSGPIISLAGTSANQTESGRIRFTEIDISQSPYYQGAYIHYNGSSNTLNIGVHNNADALTSSDTDVISIQRSTGNVGIGTTNPAFKTTIYSSSSTDSFPLVVGQANSANEFVGIGLSGFIASDGAVKAGMVLDRKSTYGVGDILFLNNSTLDNSNATTADAKMTIQSGGNVGIGTTVPATKLHVVGGGSAIVRNDTMSFDNDYDLINLGYLNSALNDVMIPVTPILDNAFIQNGNSFTTKAILGTNDSFDLGFKTAGSEKMTILANGNVGVGMTNPSYKLSINGDIQGGKFRSSNFPTLTYLDFNDTAFQAASFTMAAASGFNFVLDSNDNSPTNYFNWVIGGVTPATSRPLMKLQGDGKLGIGTTAPATKLHVVGANEAIVRNDTMSFDNDYDLINLGYLNSALNDVMIPVTPILDNAFIQNGNSFNAKAILGTNDSFDLGFKTAGSEKMTILANGNVGIGTTNPSSLLTIANNNWISAIDGSGASSINMFKVNTSNQIEVGAPLLIGPLEFAPDSGLLSFIDMPITSASTNGTPHGYSLRLDGNNLLSVYGESNGSGGIVNSAVGVGIATPQYGKLEVRNTLGNINTGITLYAGTGTTARSWLGSGDQWHLTRGTDSSYGITILNSGHTAIKGSNPVAAFEILGGSHARNSTVTYTGNKYELVNVALLNTRIGDSVFWSGSQTGDISNTNTGNVGIGAAANSSFKLNIGGSVAATGASLSGQLVMTGSGVDANISGVNKLTAYTIDPLYNIEGVNYSTYAAAIVGGVKEEYLGKLKIDEKVVIDGEEQYQAEIDFTNVEKGSDAWVWYQVVDFSKDHVDVSYIPYGNFASVYYIMTDDKIIFRSDREAEISFRITGSRYDWKKWPTIAIDQNEKGWEVNRD